MGSAPSGANILVAYSFEPSSSDWRKAIRISTQNPIIYSGSFLRAGKTSERTLGLAAAVGVDTSSRLLGVSLSTSSPDAPGVCPSPSREAVEPWVSSSSPAVKTPGLSASPCFPGELEATPGANQGSRSFAHSGFFHKTTLACRHIFICFKMTLSTHSVFVSFGSCFVQASSFSPQTLTKHFFQSVRVMLKLWVSWYISHKYARYFVKSSRHTVTS